MNKDFDFSGWANIAEAFVENPIVEVQYGGEIMPVEIAIKPSEAFVSMEDNPIFNNGIVQEMLKELKNNPEFKRRLNGRRVEEMQAEMSEAEIMEMLGEETSAKFIMDSQKQQVEQERKTKLSNQRIVIACAVRPRFTFAENFEQNKAECLSDKNNPILPVELIDDFWLQTLADVGIGKRVIWGKKAEAIGKSTLPDAVEEVAAERSLSVETVEGMPDTAS